MSKLDDIIRHFRQEAQGHREVFTKTDPPGGKNAKLFDAWADEISALRARVAQLEGALGDVKKRCLCFRATYGFDYSEVHTKLGKPGAGKRWLTPSDLADHALSSPSPALEAVRKAQSLLGDLQLGHEHNLSNPDYRPLSDHRGWCSICSAKVGLGEDFARGALAALDDAFGKAGT